MEFPFDCNCQFLALLLLIRSNRSDESIWKVSKLVGPTTKAVSMSQLLAPEYHRQPRRFRRTPHNCAVPPRSKTDPAPKRSRENSASWLARTEAYLGLGAPFTRPARQRLILIGIASFIAFAVSTYLGWVALTSSKIAGCGGELFDCGHVISSRWSLWMGIPVSLLASLTYAWIAVHLAVIAFASNDRWIGWSWFGISVSALSAGLAALWFVGLQVFVLNHLCIYCLVAHGCGIVTAATVVLTRPLGWKVVGASGVVAILGIAALVGVQLNSDPPATYQIETYEVPSSTGNAVEFEAPIFEAPASKANLESDSVST